MGIRKHKDARRVWYVVHPIIDSAPVNEVVERREPTWLKPLTVSLVVNLQTLDVPVRIPTGHHANMANKMGHFAWVIGRQHGMHRFLAGGSHLHTNDLKTCVLLYFLHAAIIGRTLRVPRDAVNRPRLEQTGQVLVFQQIPSTSTLGDYRPRLRYELHDAGPVVKCKLVLPVHPGDDPLRIHALS